MDSNALSAHFAAFRRNIVGVDQTFDGPYGPMPIRYSDWTASGRLYAPIERRLTEAFGPFVGNTHSESSATGTAMTLAYHEAQRRIKAHVGAGPEDVLITVGNGMTGGINKFQRILGLKAPQASWTCVPVSARWSSSPTWSTTATRRAGTRPSRMWR